MDNCLKIRLSGQIVTFSTAALSLSDDTSIYRCVVARLLRLARGCITRTLTPFSLGAVMKILRPLWLLAFEIAAAASACGT